MAHTLAGEQGRPPPAPLHPPWLVSLPDAASKHAALGFFDCLRAEVEEYDVVVSTVSPTFIRSYRVDPGQGNWDASIWKCELSQGIWRHRGLGGGSLVSLGLEVCSQSLRLGGWWSPTPG